MLTTDVVPSRRGVPPAGQASRDASPVSVVVSTVVDIGDSHASDGRGPEAHRPGQERQDRIAGPPRTDRRDSAGDDRGGGGTGRLDHHRDEEQTAGWGGHAGRPAPRGRRRPGTPRVRTGWPPRRTRSTGRGGPDQEHVPGHVGREHVSEAEETHRIDEAADDGQGGQGDHQGQGWMLGSGVAHVRSTTPSLLLCVPPMPVPAAVPAELSWPRQK